jgi:hypothetical protein
MQTHNIYIFVVILILFGYFLNKKEKRVKNQVMTPIIHTC